MVLLADGPAFKGAVTASRGRGWPRDLALAYADASADPISPDAGAEAFDRTAGSPTRRVIVLDEDGNLLGLLCLDPAPNRLLRDLAARRAIGVDDEGQPQRALATHGLSESSRAATAANTRLCSSSESAARPEYDSRWSQSASRGTRGGARTARARRPGRARRRPPRSPSRASANAARGCASARRSPRPSRRSSAGGRRGGSSRSQAAARPQHTVDLPQRRLELEPVEAGTREDRVRHAVAEGDRLGRALHSLEPEPGAPRASADRARPR